MLPIVSRWFEIWKSHQQEIIPRHYTRTTETQRPHLQLYQRLRHRLTE